LKSLEPVCLSPEIKEKVANGSYHCVCSVEGVAAAATKLAKEARVIENARLAEEAAEKTQKTTEAAKPETDRLESKYSNLDKYKTRAAASLAASTKKLTMRMPSAAEAMAAEEAKAAAETQAIREAAEAKAAEEARECEAVMAAKQAENEANKAHEAASVKVVTAAAIVATGASDEGELAGGGDKKVLAVAKAWETWIKNQQNQKAKSALAVACGAFDSEVKCNLQQKYCGWREEKDDGIVEVSKCRRLLPGKSK